MWSWIDMPSDKKRQLAQAAIHERAEAFLSALAATAEQVRGILGSANDLRDTQVSRERAALGKLAVDSIDVEAFTVFVEREKSIDPRARIAIEAAQKTLRELLEQREQLFSLELEPGQSLGCSVGRTLADLGRAFGAARVVELAKSGAYDDAKHGEFLRAYPFSKWSMAERAMAPPLLVECSGGELRAASLASYIDGGVKIVLVVDGDAPPAALARLITPGVFVQQSTDDSPLDLFKSFGGAAVAALLPASAVKFVHDPRAGKTAFERFSVLEVPQLTRLGPVGGISAAQQQEDLGLLHALSAKFSGEKSAKADPAGRLSAWLLNQADLSNLPA
jgi:hypothetical protein